jgi:hypothetical protein
MLLISSKENHGSPAGWLTVARARNPAQRIAA